MKLSLASVVAGAALAAQVVVAAAGPDVEASVQWPASNAFGRVTNGRADNALEVRVANHAKEDITVTRVFGAYREAQGKQRALRNTTELKLRQVIPSGQKSPLIPYTLHSENKIGDVGLRVWIEYLDSSAKKHVTLGYEGIATVVEPAGSFFDPALLFSYLVILAIIGGAGYLVYNTYYAAPKTKRTRTPRSAPATATTSATAFDTPSKGVDNEWIPEHHLRARKPAGGYTSATSGDESEGGTKRKARKGRK
ncbi:hypothetical protein OIO90_003616 [Microbotryomycetes sp. JL221]|nr:hypothetical protein OIO90_003616 [Microbotryomycetes sp. JL221]